MEVGESQQLLVFSIASKRYALPTSLTREVLQMMEPTPMPGWPDDALGLIEVRGELVPLLDIGSFLGSGPAAIRVEQFIVIVTSLGRLWGIVVDEVGGVRPMSVRSTTSWSPPELMDAHSVCKGIATDQEGTVVLLDLDALVKLLPTLEVPGKKLG